MKRLLLGIFFIIFAGELFADCHKIVTAISSDIDMTEVKSENYDDAIKAVKEMIKETKSPLQRKKSEELLKLLENKFELLKTGNEELYKEYHAFRKMLLEKYKNNIDAVIKAMSVSPGVELVQSRRSGMSDYYFSCEYSINIGNNANTGMYSCELADVQSAELIWVSQWKKIAFEKHKPADEIFPKAWSHLLATINKSKELEETVRKEIDYKNANLAYEYDDENKKEADGKQKGKLEITNFKSGEKIPWTNPRPRNIAEFTLEAKQGKFTKTSSNTLTFIPREYKEENINGKLSYVYQTYNCDDKNIQEKLFDTYTLKRTCLLGQAEDTVMATLKVPFECEEHYYTASYTKKTKKTAKVLKKYRGMGKDLKNVNEDHLEFYIYFDIAHDKVVQHFREDKSYRKTHKERYKLNMKTCQYAIEVKDKKIQLKGPRPLLRSDDMGWGIEDTTEFYVKLPFKQKGIAFTWRKLRENGGIHAQKAYSNDPFGVPKELKGKFGIDEFAKESKKEMKKQAENSADYIGKAEHDSGLKKFQKFVTVPGTPQDIQCGMDVSMESMMMQPIDATLPEKVSVKLNIRKSSKSEIAAMKATMQQK